MELKEILSEGFSVIFCMYVIIHTFGWISSPPQASNTPSDHFDLLSLLSACGRNKLHRILVIVCIVLYVNLCTFSIFSFHLILGNTPSDHEWVCVDSTLSMVGDIGEILLYITLNFLITIFMLLGQEITRL